jgi:hypothetical protein
MLRLLSVALPGFFAFKLILANPRLRRETCHAVHTILGLQHGSAYEKALDEHRALERGLPGTRTTQTCQRIKKIVGGGR